MDTITSPCEPVDVQAAKGIFPSVNLEDIKRPVRNVNLLIGIHEAGIFPFLLTRRSMLMAISDSLLQSLVLGSF